jgi:hypothetical protein
LAANPIDTVPLKLNEEVSAIDEELLKARFRDNFDLEQKHAVKADDLSQHLLQTEPDIVHFSGHGSETGEIYLRDESGTSHLVSEQALSSLFSILKGNIRCVVLNACYSEKQAKAISKHIDCVIGMSKAIGDEAAIEFAQGLYRGIAYGLDLENAFKLGCAQVDLQNLNEQNTPKILWRNNTAKRIQILKTNEDATNPELDWGSKPSYWAVVIYVGVPLIIGVLVSFAIGFDLYVFIPSVAGGFFLVLFIMIIIAYVKKVHDLRAQEKPTKQT